MISQRECERKYAKLINEVNTDAFYKRSETDSKTNCYICNCGHVTKTVDTDSGVTPFMFNCEKCNQLAKSCFYKDIFPNLQPTFEWYRPTLKEVLKLRNKESTLEHIFNGGLLSRKLNLESKKGGEG